MPRGVLLNLPYCGCIGHWAQIVAADSVTFEAAGGYQRRTFRSRTVIVNSQGQLPISVPVEGNYARPYSQIQINYDTPWQLQHLRALLSAYNNTPFFEYFADDFTALLSHHYLKLWDLNVDMMHLVANCLGFELHYSLTQSFTTAPDGFRDLRIAIEPKFQHLLSQEVPPSPYYQVFDSLLGFIPGVSILDLLFNMGPEAKLYLLHMAAELQSR